jgi:hypothetical protein
MQVREPDHSGMKSHDVEKVIIHTAHFELKLDANTGAITRLVTKGSDRSWASKENPLALFTYQPLTQEDYKAFLHTYVVSKEWWAPQDFGKPNIESKPSNVFNTPLFEASDSELTYGKNAVPL